MIEIQTINAELYEAYTAYVARHPESRFGHDLAWAMALRDAYGVALEHLIAFEDGKVVGVCPLFFSKPLLGGAHYVTSPFPSYIGPLYDSMPVLNALLDVIKSKTAEAQFAEVLAPVALPVSDSTTLPFIDKLDFTFRVPLNTDTEKVFNTFSRDYKRILRKTEALKDMELSVDTDGTFVDPFYKLYVSIYAGKHGFIPHTRKLFQKLFARYPKGSVRIYLAKINNKFIGAMFTLWTHNEVYYAWSAVNSNTTHHPTHWLLWKIIQDASADGYQWFNMGESARHHHGLNHFKEGWGTEVLEPCRYFIPGKVTMPTARLFDRVSWMKQIISHTPAVVITNILSPAIRFFL